MDAEAQAREEMKQAESDKKAMQDLLGKLNHQDKFRKRAKG